MSLLQKIGKKTAKSGLPKIFKVLILGCLGLRYLKLKEDQQEEIETNKTWKILLILIIGLIVVFVAVALFAHSFLFNNG